MSIMTFTLNSWAIQVHVNKVVTWSLYLICNMVLCNEPFVQTEEDTESYNKQCYILFCCQECSCCFSHWGHWRWNVLEKKFLLVEAVFPAEKALQYCNSNVPAMDKIFFLAKIANISIDNSASILDSEHLFGSPDTLFILEDVKRNWMRCLVKKGTIVNLTDWLIALFFGSLTSTFLLFFHWQWFWQRGTEFEHHD